MRYACFISALRNVLIFVSLDIKYKINANTANTFYLPVKGSARMYKAFINIQMY